MAESPRSAETMEAAEAVKGRSLWVDARRRLFRNSAADGSTGRAGASSR